MASRFDEMVANDVPVFLDEFGESGTYTPAGGVGKTIMAVRDIPINVNIDEGNVDLQFKAQTIAISARNDTEGQVTVKVRGAADGAGGDTFQFGGVGAVWYVTQLLETDAGFHTLEICDNPGVRP